MSRNNSIKKTVRQYKRLERKKHLQILSIRISIAVFLVSCILVILSFVFRERVWLSNFLLSISGSLSTGLILYWLSNLRNNTVFDLERDIASLKDLNEEMMKAIWFRPYVDSFKADQKNYSINEAKIFRDLMSALEQSKDNLSDKVFHQLRFDFDDPFDHDKLRDYSERFSSLDQENVLSSIAEQFSTIHDKSLRLLNEKESLLSFLKKTIL